MFSIGALMILHPRCPSMSAALTSEKLRSSLNQKRKRSLKDQRSDTRQQEVQAQ